MICHGRGQVLMSTLQRFLCFLYQLLEVPRGPWRSGNVSERLWDVLELLYIEFLIKIHKRLSFTKRLQHQLFLGLTIRI